MDWKPIETAPKGWDKPVLVAYRFRGQMAVCEAYWKDHWYGDKKQPGWMLANCDEEYGDYLDATHWMPLPEPPADQTPDRSPSDSA